MPSTGLLSQLLPDQPWKAASPQRRLAMGGTLPAGATATAWMVVERTGTGRVPVAGSKAGLAAVGAEPLVVKRIVEAGSASDSTTDWTASNVPPPGVAVGAGGR